MSGTRPEQPAPSGRHWHARHGLARAAIVTAIGLGAVALVVAPAGAQTAVGNAPFATGKLVSRSGSTLDIQGFAGDSKVIVTSSTKYQQTESADTSAVTKGSCVRVTGTGNAKSVSATNVSVMPAASKCTVTTGFGGGGGFGRRFGNGGNGGNGANGGNGNFPNGSRPTFTGPAGGNGNGTGNFPTDIAAVTGKVTQVSGTTVKVKGQFTQLNRNRGQNSNNSNSNSNKNTAPKPKNATVTVTLPSTTRVSSTVAATDSVLTTGACVTAAGTTDSVGTVTARTVTVSPADADGNCGGGFRGGFGGGRGGPGGGGNGVFNGGGQGGNNNGSNGNSNGNSNGTT